MLAGFLGCLFVAPASDAHLPEYFGRKFVLVGEALEEPPEDPCNGDRTALRRQAETLKKTVGKDVKINATVDESLIGGLVVKVGSKMIDTSIRSRLNSLQNAMKEVG